MSFVSWTFVVLLLFRVESKSSRYAKSSNTLCPIGIEGVGNGPVVKEPASAAVQRRARISKQSESQLPVVAAIGVHCPHNCRASLLRTVPGTDEVDGSAAGVAAASTAWGHAEAGGTD